MTVCKSNDNLLATTHNPTVDRPAINYELDLFKHWNIINKVEKKLKFQEFQMGGPKGGPKLFWGGQGPPWPPLGAATGRTHWLMGERIVISSPSYVASPPQKKMSLAHALFVRLSARCHHGSCGLLGQPARDTLPATDGVHRELLVIYY